MAKKQVSYLPSIPSFVCCKQRRAIQVVFATAWLATDNVFVVGAAKPNPPWMKSCGEKWHDAKDGISYKVGIS